MKILENNIINDIRNTILSEDLDDLKDNNKIDNYFQNELNIFKFFRKFKMNEVTKKYIEMFEKALNEIAQNNFTEEKLEELRNKFKKEESAFKLKASNILDGRYYTINKHDNLEIIDKYEKLSFSIYNYYEELYKKIDEKTAEEKYGLLKETSLIHNYLRDFSFATTADTVGRVVLECKNS